MANILVNDSLNFAYDFFNSKVSTPQCFLLNLLPIIFKSLPSENYFHDKKIKIVSNNMNVLQGVVSVIFGISEASYGQTYADWTFLKHTSEWSIFDLNIPFDSLVPLSPTIWLTTVKDESLSYFRRNKDPRAYIGKFCFFRFSRQGSKIWLNVPKKGVFWTFW